LTACGVASAPTTVRAAPVTATRIYDSLALGMAAGGTARDIQSRGLGGAPATASAAIVNLTATRRHRVRHRLQRQHACGGRPVGAHPAV